MWITWAAGLSNLLDFIRKHQSATWQSRPIAAPNHFEALFFSFKFLRSSLQEKIIISCVSVLNIPHPIRAEKMLFFTFSDVEDHSLAFGEHKTIKISKLTPPPASLRKV